MVVFDNFSFLSEIEKNKFIKRDGRVEKDMGSLKTENVWRCSREWESELIELSW